MPHNAHTHSSEWTLGGRRCWHSNSQKGFVPTDRRKHSALNGTNVINMLSACSAVYCTETLTHSSTHSQPEGHFTSGYVSVWWIVMASAGRTSLGNEMKSMWRTKSGHVHSLSSFIQPFIHWFNIPFVPYSGDNFRLFAAPSIFV